MATRVTCWCTSVGKVVDVLAGVAYCSELDSVVGSALFLKLFPKTDRK